MSTTEITISADAVPMLREAARRLRGGSATITATAARRGEAAIDRLLADTDPIDPVRTALYDAIERAPAIRAKAGKYASKALKDTLADVPTFLRVEDFDDIVALDVRSIVEKLREWPEFAPIRKYPFALTWRTKAGNSQGAVVLGTCRALGARERLTWRGKGKPPFWEMTFALDLWLLATPYERERLVHHEMMHAAVEAEEDDEETGEEGEAKPGIHPHPVEEFPITAARFGAIHPEHIRLADAILAHPDLAAARIEYAVTPGEQLALFPSVPRSAQ